MLNHPIRSSTALVGYLLLAILAVALAVPMGAWAQNYKEAPMLSARVKAGTLPAVDKRLPQDLEVITPLEKVGKYGGDIRRGLRGSNDHNNLLRFIGPQGLTR